MLRTKARLKNRISNRLAIFASLMLLISSLAGMSQTQTGPEEALENFADNRAEVQEQLEAGAAINQRPAKNTGFKVSLLLFRLD